MVSLEVSKFRLQTPVTTPVTLLNTITVHGRNGGTSTLVPLPRSRAITGNRGVALERSTHRCHRSDARTNGQRARQAGRGGGDGAGQRHVLILLVGIRSTIGPAHSDANHLGGRIDRSDDLTPDLVGGVRSIHRRDIVGDGGPVILSRYRIDRRERSPLSSSSCPMRVASERCLATSALRRNVDCTPTRPACRMP